MDWVPVFLVAIKAFVLGTGMYFAIKWHYDQGNKESGKKMEMRAVLRASGKVSAVFMLGLLGVVLLAFALGRTLGLDLTWP